MSCPSPEVLLRGWMGLLDPGEAARLAAHAAGCDRCRRIESDWRAAAAAASAGVAGGLDGGGDCPDEMTLVHHLAGRLEDEERERVLGHVADCRRCLGLLAEAVVGLDDPLPAAEPVGAEAREAAQRLAGVAHAGAVSRAPGRRRLLWLAASVAAALVVVTQVGGPPRRTAPPEEAQPVLRQPPAAATALPELLAPREGERLQRTGLLRWRAVAGARRYRVELLDDRGDRIWSATVAMPQARIPESIPLNPGDRYFAWVSAELPDGTWVRAPSVAFELEGLGPGR